MAAVSLFSETGLEDEARVLALLERGVSGDRPSLSLFRLAQYVDPLLTQHTP